MLFVVHQDVFELVEREHSNDKAAEMHPQVKTWHPSLSHCGFDNDKIATFYHDKGEQNVEVLSYTITKNSVQREKQCQSNLGKRAKYVLTSHILLTNE